MGSRCCNSGTQPFSCTQLGGCSVGDLADVDATAPPPAAGDALVWNGGQWVPGEPSAAACVTDDPCNPLTLDGGGCLQAPAEHTSVTASVAEAPIIGRSRTDVETTSPGHTILDTDLAALVVTNPSSCRDMAFAVTAFGTTRAVVDPANTLSSESNEARIDFRLNGGPWLASGTAQVRSVEASPAPYTMFQGEQGHAEITIPPGGTLTIDRATAFYWEQDIIISDTPGALEWGLPGIVVHGTTI